MLILTLLVILQSVALMLSLSLSGVFYTLDAEAYRNFENLAQERAQSFNSEFDGIIRNTAVNTTALNETMIALSEESRKPLSSMYRDDAFYAQATEASVGALLNMLEGNVTGAFVMLNGSNSQKENRSGHSAVYIRNAAAGSSVPGTENLLMEVGPIAIAREYKIPTSVNWTLDIEFLGDDAETDYALYYNPIQASRDYPRSEIERYGYWMPPASVLNDGVNAVYYTMPLLDQEGVAYGVAGVEITVSHMAQSYIPGRNLPYQNGFFVLARQTEDGLNLDWFIPSGPVASNYLVEEGSLALEPLEDTGLYVTEIEGMGVMDCALEELNMYSRNSPFAAEAWTLAGFVPEDVLNASSNDVRASLLGNVLVTIAIAFTAIFALTYLATRKISGLSRHVEGLTPNTMIHLERTGMKEIDDLSSAVEKLNKSVLNASKAMTKILELTHLPLGVFEVTDDSDHVIVSDFVRDLLGISPGRNLSEKEWSEHYGKLVAKKTENYEDTYSFRQGDGDRMWLRIVESPTETGKVGIVMDVTKDVEERRKLAHELDYDALTQLLNRNAFKREVHNRIASQPDMIGAMLFSDLDNLKYINDTFGHDMGDRLIIRAGEMFGEFRRMGGIVSRISGDEFAIYLHGFKSKNEARVAIENQYSSNSVYSLQTPDGSAQRVRYSSGIAWYPSDSNNVTDLLKLSDYAMYEAKNNRKGTIYEFDSVSYSQNAYLLENREAINRLLDEGLIRFAYQPIIDLKTGEVFAYEALMRPTIPAFGNPVEILKVAAAQSKLGQLERLVVFKAFEDIKKNYARLKGRKVFVNSIPSQMLPTGDLDIIGSEYADVIKSVVIEITEVESNDFATLKDKVEYIRTMGMGLAIDDFGSGYSNEVRMLSIEPEIVKIDMMMIQGIHYDADKRKLVENMMSFCHPKGIKVIAEGVEDPQDLETLAEIGMDYIQGYYTGMPEFDFTEISVEAAIKIRSILEKKRED